MKLLKSFVAAMFILMGCAAANAQLPSVTLKTLDGKTVNTSEISNDGKPWVLTFFATWCKPCNRELKAIHEVYPDWQEETGMKVVAVSVDEAQNMNKVRPLVDSEGWEYEILLDPNSDLRRQLGIQMIPHCLIIDGNGKIAESRSGYTEGAESHIIEKIRELEGK
ncbi:MAG: TlpA family protein disulfide reductase [Bacteroides sp.]|nr:TlpA family protein disulfide reductase [Bacteroidales bacterium]MBD5242706.1 TlpA family protein disulfide reductase [Barnesiella sp.]MBD5315845.1 TlpA family protein disulfide reductase [Bacteroides sp.]MDE7448735.1 TlpA family protein disulfide reductase [Paramuribaculum sp.]